MSRIIGIDLGTTNSCVAVCEGPGTPSVLPSSDGSRTTPSVVAFTPGGVNVGERARRQLVSHPDTTVFGAKRLIGRKVSAGEIRELAQSAPFKIAAAPNGDAWVRIGEELRSPQEISAHVLRHLKELAEERLGEPVTRAVVTVPAYFDDAQRQATRDAGSIAGLEIMRIVNEPTAAALAYGAHRVRPGRRVIAVFDLGGGTFDISIMAVEAGVFEVLSTGGDSALGGNDWDQRLIRRIVDEVFDAHRVDISTNPTAMSRLKEAAEQAKHNLTHEKQTVIQLPYLLQHEGGDIHLERPVTRAEYEELTADLAARLRAPCEQAVTDAGLTTEELEEVLLVGGMTRWPQIQRSVSEIFGCEPSRGANPDEVVAAGAAAHGAILGGASDDTVLVDVLPHTLSIQVGDNRLSTLIARNAMLPARIRRMFATTEDNQEHVTIQLYQGDGGNTTDARKLGEVRLAGLPPGKAGTVRLELVVTVNVESMVEVAARELSTGKRAHTTVRASGGLTGEDLVRIVERQRAAVMERDRADELEPPGE